MQNKGIGIGIRKRTTDEIVTDLITKLHLQEKRIEALENDTELETRIEHHANMIYNEHAEKLKELEKYRTSNDKFRLAVTDKFGELEQKLKDCITHPELEGNIEAFSERQDTIEAVLKDAFESLISDRIPNKPEDWDLLMIDKFKYLLKKLEGEPDEIKNIDLCHKCDLAYSTHSRNLAGILICPKEEQEDKPIYGCMQFTYCNECIIYPMGIGCKKNMISRKREEQEATEFNNVVDAYELKECVKDGKWNTFIKILKSIIERENKKQIAEFLDDIKYYTKQNDSSYWRITREKWEARKNG